MTAMTADPLPAFFFAHGTPALLKEAEFFKERFGSEFEGYHDGPQADYLRQLGQQIMSDYRPKALVVFSAHWETEDGAPIEIMDNTDEWQSKHLYYDYYGFPDAMYKVQFKSRTDSTISARVAELLDRANIHNKVIRNTRGLDHGVYVPFKHMFGETCDIPIIEVSQFVDARKNMALGKALYEIQKEGCLILSGGLTIHSLQDFGSFDPGMAKQGYKDFEARLKDVLRITDTKARTKKLVDVQKDPWFEKAHPTPEHFTPIYIASGAGADRPVKILSEFHGALTVAFGVP